MFGVVGVDVEDVLVLDVVGDVDVVDDFVHDVDVVVVVDVCCWWCRW